MDCDDVMLLLAAREQRTLTNAELGQLGVHVADCRSCQLLAEQPPDDQWKVLAKVPEDALDDRDLLVLPMVDPIVFADGQELSRGGMGRIVKAHDRRLGRDVAIKETLEANLRHRFEREVAITARLQHPAIVPIYEAGAWPDGTVFYTMRLVPGGKTLGHAIDAATTFSERLALLPHVIAATEAMAYAHAQGVIHRDLKPSNILVGEFGETVLIDWGLAKEIGLDEVSLQPSGRHGPNLTLVGTVIGTPCFMSPEQAAGKALDERDDVYALGAILYHLLAGEPPYWDSTGDARSAELIVEVTLLRPPTPIEKLAPDAPKDLLEIVDKAMARKREERFPNAGAMAAELQRFTAGKLLASREYSLAELIGRWVKKHRAAVAVGAAALTVLAIVATLAVINVTRSRADERTARVAAEAANEDSKRSVAALLEEQGRVEWLGDEPERALVYLAAAYRAGRDTVATRHLLAAASRDTGLLLSRLETGETGSLVGARDDGRIVTVNDKTIDVWKDGAREATHPIASSTWRTTLSASAREVVTIDDEHDVVACWDTRTGAKRWERPVGFADVLDVMIDPTATMVMLVEASSNGRTELRSMATGDVVATLTTGTKWSAAAEAWSRDGSRVAIAGKDSTLRVWETKTFTQVASIGIEQLVSSLRFGGNDTLVIGVERMARLWRIGAPRTIDLPGHYDVVNAIAITAKADLIATGDMAGSVRLWTGEGALIGESRALVGVIGALELSPDESLLAGAGTDNHVMLWDRELLPVHRLAAFRSGQRTIAWSPDGMKLLTSGTADDAIGVWQRPATNRIARIQMRSFSLAGGKLLVVDDGGATLRDVATGRELVKLDLVRRPDKRYGTVQIDRGATRALIENGPGWYEIYDLVRGTLIASFVTRKNEPGTHVRGSAITLSGDGRFVIEHDNDHEPRARVYDAAAGTLVCEIAVPRRVAISGDGSLLAGVLDGKPAIWRIPSGERVALSHAGPLPAIARPPAAQAPIAFDPSGTRLVVVGEKEVAIVDTASGREVVRLRGRAADSITQVAFTADGTRLLTTTYDRISTVWDLASGSPLISIDEALHAAISPDGTRLATGSIDGTLRIWDVATRRLLENLHGHRHPIELLAFSGDGSRLVAHDNNELGIGETGTLWDVALESRAPASIDEVAQRLPWKLEQGFVVPR